MLYFTDALSSNSAKGHSFEIPPCVQNCIHQCISAAGNYVYLNSLSIYYIYKKKDLKKKNYGWEITAVLFTTLTVCWNCIKWLFYLVTHLMNLLNNVTLFPLDNSHIYYKHILIWQILSFFLGAESPTARKQHN